MTSDGSGGGGALRLQFPVEKKGREGKERADKDDHAPADGEAFAHEHLEEAGAEGEKEEAVERSDEADGEGHVREVFQRHRDAEEDEVGDPVEDRGEAEAVDGT